MYMVKKPEIQHCDFVNFYWVRLELLAFTGKFQILYLFYGAALT